MSKYKPTPKEQILFLFILSGQSQLHAFEDSSLLSVRKAALDFDATPQSNCDHALEARAWSKSRASAQAGMQHSFKNW
jgi:hypothetical protein